MIQTTSDENRARAYDELGRIVADYLAASLDTYQRFFGASAPPRRGPPSEYDAIAEKIARIVAERTGYPPAVLDFALELEADLGIDTIKQADILAEVRRAFALPLAGDSQIRDYPTLAHLVDFVLSRGSSSSPCKRR